MSLNVKKIFYVFNTLFSFVWAWIYVVIGARGRGKTYGAKKWLLNGWLYHKHKFIILRDTERECEVISQDNGVRFWGDVLGEKKYSNLKITMTKESVFINGVLAGYVMPASLFHLFKGSQYQDVKRVLYDEFIREKKQVRYNGNRALQFLNTLMTVARFRTDFKIVLTANALDKGDVLLSDVFGFKLNGFGIYKNKAKGIVLDYAPNSEEFEQYQRSGNVYKLVQGTRFEGNLIGNQFAEDDSGMFFDRKKPSTLFGIYYDKEGTAVRIYESRDGDIFYATSDINPNSVNYMRYTFDLRVANHKIKLADNQEKKKLQLLFSNNLIKFESSYILGVFKDIIK